MIFLQGDCFIFLLYHWTGTPHIGCFFQVSSENPSIWWWNDPSNFLLHIEPLLHAIVERIDGSNFLKLLMNLIHCCGVNNGPECLHCIPSLKYGWSKTRCLFVWPFCMYSQCTDPFRNLQMKAEKCQLRSLRTNSKDSTGRRQDCVNAAVARTGDLTNLLGSQNGVAPGPTDSQWFSVFRQSYSVLSPWSWGYPPKVEQKSHHQSGRIDEYRWI